LPLRIGIIVCGVTIKIQSTVLNLEIKIIK